MNDPEVMDDRQLLDQLRYVEFLDRLWAESRSLGGYVPLGVARDKAALEAEVEKRQREIGGTLLGRILQPRVQFPREGRTAENPE